MKKVFTLALAAVMILSALAGCGGAATGTEGTTTAAAAETSAATQQETTAKEMKEAKVVWYWNTSNAQLPEDGYIAKKTKEDINVTYVHVKPSSTNFDERLNLMIASNEMPDVITCPPATKSRLLAEGLIQPIEQYMNDQYIPNVIRIQKNWDVALQLNTGTDGKVYGVPFTNNVNRTNFTAIRMDWLKNLNLNVPTTLEELKDVLVQFTKNDPDKNGKDDTYGTMIDKMWGSLGYAFEMGARWDMWYKTDNGQVALGYFLPRSKDFLKYVRSLVETGALDPQLMTQTAANIDEKMKAGKIGFTFGYQGSEQARDLKSILPEADWQPMQPPKGIYDKGYMNSSGVFSLEHVIASKVEDPEPIFRLMNYMADDKSTSQDNLDFTGSYWTSRYGEKGVNWDIVDGKFDAGGAVEKFATQNKTDTWSSRAARFKSQFDFTFLASLPDWMRVFEETLYSYPNYYDIPDSDPNKYILTDGFILPEDVANFVQQMDVKWEEFYGKAVLGTIDIDKGWDEFIATAEKTEPGLQKVKEVMTKALTDAGRLK